MLIAVNVNTPATKRNGDGRRLALIAFYRNYHLVLSFKINLI